MGNVIKRNSVFMESEMLVDSSIHKKGERIGLFKMEDGWKSRWQDKRVRHFASHLRNKNYHRIEKQYSMEDIVYYLQRRNRDYYTVMWEMLVDAVNTTFQETEVKCIDDIYDYVSENLI